MRNWHQFLGLKILKFFYADSDLGFVILSTLDPGSGMEKVRSADPGSGINIPDTKHYVHPSMEEDGAVVSIISLRPASHSMVFRRNTVQDWKLSLICMILVVENGRSELQKVWENGCSGLPPPRQHTIPHQGITSSVAYTSADIFLLNFHLKSKNSFYEVSICIFKFGFRKV